MKPARGALRNNIPGYAGGGFIDGLKRAVGMAPAETMREKFARQDAERAAKQPPAPKPVAAAPEGQTAIASYASGTMTGDRKKQMEEAIGKKVGGAIRGKGTGTSDEIPIMASNGEFMIKASSVKKIGIEALEALNAVGDQPDEKDDPAEAKAEYGMKCGGAVRKKMATGGLVTDEERKRLEGQNAMYIEGAKAANPPQPAPAAKPFPPSPTSPEALHSQALQSAQTLTANKLAKADSVPPAPVVAPAPAQTPAPAPVAAPTPAAPAPAGAVRPPPVPGDGQMSYGDQMRNLGSALASVPATALKTIVSAPGYGMNSPASPAPAPVATQPAPAAQVAPTPPATASAPAPGGDIPTAPMLNGVAGKDIGYGATRFDAPGKSPLFTNMTDAAGLTDNAKLQGRAPVSAENQSAMNGIQARQDAGDQAARNKMQYDAEVAGAKAINEQQTRFHLEQAALKGNKAALQMLGNATADATTRRDQDIRSKGQDIQAGALRQSSQFNQKLAQDKFGIEQSQEARNVAKAGVEAKQQERLQAAFDAYDKDPSEKSAERVRVLMGKEKAAPPDSWGIRKVTDATGAVTEIPYNKNTGEDRGSQQVGQAPLPPGMVKQVGTANGKPVYLDKNGKQVIAKG